MGGVMVGIFDKFRSAEKRAELEAEREAAAAEEAERHRKEVVAQKIRDEERRANAKWEYQEIADEMRGTTMSMASVTSENTVEMLPPYRGGSQAVMAIRIKNNKLEVVVSVTKGQLHIETGRHYKIAYKVDGAPVVAGVASLPEQVSHKTLFVSNPNDLLLRMAGGDILIFEANFYKSGAKQFRFPISGLDRRFIPKR